MCTPSCVYHSVNHAEADPGGGNWGDRPPKPYKSNFIHHGYVHFGKQHSRYKVILLSVVFSQQCCVHLSYSGEPVMRLDHQILRKSPPPLTLPAGSAPVTTIGTCLSRTSREWKKYILSTTWKIYQRVRKIPLHKCQQDWASNSHMEQLLLSNLSILFSVALQNGFLTLWKHCHKPDLCTSSRPSHFHDAYWE